MKLDPPSLLKSLQIRRQPPPSGPELSRYVVRQQTFRVSLYEIVEVLEGLHNNRFTGNFTVHFSQGAVNSAMAEDRVTLLHE